MAITVKELEDVKLEIIENIETILRVEDGAVAEMDKMAVVKMLLMSASLADTAIKYAAEAESMRDAAEFEARVAHTVIVNKKIYNEAREEYVTSRMDKHILFYLLKAARLAVEAEMDAEHGNEA